MEILLVLSIAHSELAHIIKGQLFLWYVGEPDVFKMVKNINRLIENYKHF